MIDEGLFPEEALMNRQSLVAILFRMEHPTSHTSILDAGHDVVAWFKNHPEGPPVKKLFRELLVAGLERLKLPETVPIPEKLEEIVTMHAAHIERWTKELELKGRQKEAVDILLCQLPQRFGDLPDWARDKITKADLPTLKEWILRVLNARFLKDVFED